MKNFLCLLILTFSFSSTGQRQLSMDEVDVNKLLKDILYTNSGDQITIFFWIPDMYWDVMASRDKKTFTPEVLSQLKQMLNNKSIFFAVSGKINAYSSQFVAKEDSYIRTNLAIQFNGKTYKPIPESKLSEELNMLNDYMKPMFTKMLGDMGSGMTLYYFDILDNEGNNQLDPYSNSDFTVNLGSLKHTFHLPLPSLFTDSKCANDGELFPANYEYCPYHGSKLIAQ